MWRMRRARMTVVQECRKAVSDNGIIDCGREQLLLRFAREIRPNLECGTPEQFGELVLVHRELPVCGVGTASVPPWFPRKRATIGCRAGSPRTRDNRCLLAFGLCQLVFPTEYRPAA